MKQKFGYSHFDFMPETYNLQKNKTYLRNGFCK